jgi:hypothetical protein
MPSLSDPSLLGRVAIALAILLLVQTLRLYWQAGKAKRSAKKRSQKALYAERAARRLLHKSGYRVLESQPAASYLIYLDHRSETIELRCDYLVEKEEMFFIAEVKSGAQAPDIHFGPTRRQLLEYQLVFNADGVLLVDMESKSIHTVDFCELLPAPDVDTE